MRDRKHVGKVRKSPHEEHEQSLFLGVHFGPTSQQSPVIIGSTAAYGMQKSREESKAKKQEHTERENLKEPVIVKALGDRHGPLVGNHPGNDKRMKEASIIPSDPDKIRGNGNGSSHAQKHQAPHFFPQTQSCIESKVDEYKQRSESGLNGQGGNHAGKQREPSTGLVEEPHGCENQCHGRHISEEIVRCAHEVRGKAQEKSGEHGRNVSEQRFNIQENEEHRQRSYHPLHQVSSINVIPNAESRRIKERQQRRTVVSL